MKGRKSLLRWRRDDMKKEEMERAAPIIAREGNELKIINKMKEMIEDKDMASTFECSSKNQQCFRYTRCLARSTSK